jgi:hypothetical protein
MATAAIDLKDGHLWVRDLCSAWWQYTGPPDSFCLYNDAGLKICHQVLVVVGNVHLLLLYGGRQGLGLQLELIYGPGPMSVMLGQTPKV